MGLADSIPEELVLTRQLSARTDEVIAAAAESGEDTQLTLDRITSLLVRAVRELEVRVVAVELLLKDHTEG